MSARIDRARGASALACVALLLTPFGAAGAPKEPTLAVRCAAVASVTLPPGPVASPTCSAQINTVTMIPANAPANQSGEFCRITGSIKGGRASTPDLHFDLNLPRRWNGRALQVGASGYDGVVVSGIGVMPFSSDRAPLAQGYATFGDDSGHIGNPALAVFGLDDEAVANFGYAHLKKTHDAALALILRIYGRLPERVYFAGGSTGGREGYTVVQRFPDDYDGVIANSPALNYSGMRLLGVKVGQAEYTTPAGFCAASIAGTGLSAHA